METTLQEIQNSQDSYSSSKVYLVTLQEEAYVYDIGNVKEFKCRFFIGSNGIFCYQPLKMKRRGFGVNFNRNVEKIVEVTTKKEFNVLDNAKALLKKMHPNAWTELRAKLQKAVDENNPELLSHEYMLQGKVRYRSVTHDIKKYERWGKESVLNAIKDAFDNKKEYRWSHETYRHTGRDISLSVKPQEDGSLLAWFQSEYMGCGNGDYYLLINPTTAIFAERD